MYIQDISGGGVFLFSSKSGRGGTFQERYVYKRKNQTEKGKTYEHKEISHNCLDHRLGGGQQQHLRHPGRHCKGSAGATSFERIDRCLVRTGVCRPASLQRILAAQPVGDGNHICLSWQHDWSCLRRSVLCQNAKARLRGTG